MTSVITSCAPNNACNEFSLIRSGLKLSIFFHQNMVWVPTFSGIKFPITTGFAYVDKPYIPLCCVQCGIFSILIWILLSANSLDLSVKVLYWKLIENFSGMSKLFLNWILTFRDVYMLGGGGWGNERICFIDNLHHQHFFLTAEAER